MILTTDIQFYLSAPQAASGYTSPGSPGNSLGRYISTSQLSSTPMDALFTDLTGAQNAALQVDYACLFVYNSNTVDTMLDPVAWLPVGLLGGSNQAVFAIGADPTGPSVLSSSPVQAVSISSPIITPSGVTSWASPSASPSGGVAMANIPPLNCAAVWISRTANGVAAQNTAEIEITFESIA